MATPLQQVVTPSIIYRSQQQLPGWGPGPTWGTPGTWGPSASAQWGPPVNAWGPPAINAWGPPAVNAWSTPGGAWVTRGYGPVPGSNIDIQPSALPRQPPPRHVRFEDEFQTLSGKPSSVYPRDSHPHTMFFGSGQQWLSNLLHCQQHQYRVGQHSSTASGLTAPSIPAWMSHSLSPQQFHPLLAGSSHQQSILLFDLSQDSFSPFHLSSAEATSAKPLSAGELSQPATFPAMQRMSITYREEGSQDDRSWTIILQPDASDSYVPVIPGMKNEPTLSGPVFITVHDVLHAVYHAFHKQIRVRDWYSLNPDAQQMVARAYEKRQSRATPSPAADSGSEQKQGVKWVDFLQDKCMFQGLSCDDRNFGIGRLVLGRQ